jgi:N4-(beta-N-acetylglucosaminyl)-L-asparaginase
MPRKISRREFVKTGASTGVLAATAPASVLAAQQPAQGPTLLLPRTVSPVVISSANGNKFKNGGPRTGVVEAFERITRGEDVLDALIAGVNIVELDPEEDSVGYGGLPNADGVVQLDSSVMHGPRKRAGAVACLEGVRTPSLVAKAVLENTSHILLVGKGAQDFARRFGFKIEDDLNTENSRGKWLEFKRRTDPERFPDPTKRSEAIERARHSMIADGLIDPQHLYGTINCNGINAAGQLCGVTTTSGLAWKIPGRVGDSPILGAGLYVDGEIGAAGSTGLGEMNLFSLSSYLIVEALRRGLHPKDAGIEALRRIGANTTDKRLLDSKGRPNFDMKFYVLNRKGEYASVAMRAENEKGKEGLFAVCTEKGPETLRCEALYPPAEPKS